MKPLALERRKGETRECVIFYEYFYCHKVEEEGRSSTVNTDYDRVGITRDECIQNHLDSGYTGVGSQ